MSLFRGHVHDRSWNDAYESSAPSPAPALPEEAIRYDDAGGLNLLSSALGPQAMQFVMDTDIPTTSLPTILSISGAYANDDSDEAVGGSLARSQYDVTGAGIKVGILSDSFNLGGGYAADVAAGNLPAGIQVLEEGPTGGGDEGRAMAQLVYKIAPGAQILFHTATNGEADFAAGIEQLAAAGCQVIVDDVAYLDEPFFQDGSPLQQAVEQVVGEGVSYFTAASNEGRISGSPRSTEPRPPCPGCPAAGTWPISAVHRHRCRMRP